jgi:GT2 family glycosyltransferase/glycosyltransferase involved in cell wall biosynthesis
VVLFATYSGALGGAERLLIDWARALNEERCLACPEGPLAAAARAAGMRVFPLLARSGRLRAGIARRARASVELLDHSHELRRLVSSLEPELVVAWGMRSAIALLVGPQPRAPVVFHHNDMLPGPLIGTLVRVAAAKAPIVTVPSQAVAADLGCTGALAERIKVVHPGVDLERFSMGKPPAHPPTVIALGALVAWKRPDIAIEACELAQRRHPDLRLRLVGAPLEGDDSFVSELRARAARLDGAIEFAGPSADVPSELARTTCLLHCAEREPFGLAILEAMAAGRPVVVPAAAGPAEIADQSCGFLYPPGDASAAADALGRLLADPDLADQMGAAGRERARTVFDGARARARWAAMVAPALRPRPPGAVPSSAVEVVTVTRNSSAVLGDLLRSVRRYLPDARALVVDCASSDGTVELARTFARTHVIALRENVGFGRACNVGVAHAAAPVTALLNPDVELLDDSLLSAVGELLQGGDLPQGGESDRLLAPLVLSADGSRQDTVHPIPGSLAELARAVLPPGVVPPPLGPALAPWRSPSARPVGWAVACALIGRTELLRRLGPFDERFFLYGEDLDLGLRAAQAGVQTWFWPSARVLHHRAHSTRAEFGGEPFELLARARREAVGRRLGRRRLALDDSSQALTFATRIAAKRSLGRVAMRERHQLDALMRARRAERITG